MRGYWKNNKGTTIGGTSPTGEHIPYNTLINNVAPTGEIVGIPPYIIGATESQWDSSSTFYKTYLLDVDALTYINLGNNVYYANADSAIRVVGKNKTGPIPVFSGFSNRYTVSPPNLDVTNNFLTKTFDINKYDTTYNIKCYDVGCYVFKIQNSASNPYTGAAQAAATYKETVDLNNFIPKWTGNWGGLQYGTYQDNQQVIQKVNLKQNKHYANCTTKTGQITDLDFTYCSTDTVGGGILSRYVPRYLGTLTHYNLDTDFGFNNKYNCGSLDTVWSKPNPMGSYLTSCIGGYLKNGTPTDVYQNTTNSNKGIPFLLNNFMGKELNIGYSQPGPLMMGEYYIRRTSFSNNLDAQNKPVLDVELNEQGLTKYGIEFDTSEVIMLPKIKSNQIVYGGDGAGIFDQPIKTNYTYNNRTFNYKNPARYMYNDGNNYYIIITYLKNDILTLTTLENFTANSFQCNWLPNLAINAGY